MCRSADQLHRVDGDQIKIRAFSVKLVVKPGPCIDQQSLLLLPDSLTLVFLPRITGSPLDIDGSKIRPDSSAFLTLHRVVSSEETLVVGYASRERVRASEGLRYEVLLGDLRLMSGVFRRDDDEEWGMGLRCLLEEEVLGVEVEAAEVWVAAEGRVSVCEKVEMVVRPRPRRRRKVVMGLEEIPECKEDEWCSCCCDGDAEEEEAEESGRDGEKMTAKEEEDLESVGWAVNVGLWVLCLGVGLLVSKASSRRLRRRIFS